MLIRDRVKELRRVKAGLLRPHPHNWRLHPTTQQDALRGILAEIGYAGALVARELSDGTLELIDGHLRAETTPDMEVPVLVVDLDESEAAKLLAIHDPLAAMAETNHQTLAALLDQVETESEAVRAMLDNLVTDPQSPVSEVEKAIGRPVEVPEVFQVVVECRDEAEQQAVFERMTAEGYDCKLLTL